MFVSDTHLPQLLPPEAYYERAWHERELDRVLRPAWWAVALVEEFPRDGDFITFDHVDVPVILRRSGGRIHGYRNVCAHRLAKLTGKAHGHCDVLRCEYHGWEYAESGATQRIPDAPSFRPLEKGQLGLGTLRVETKWEDGFVEASAELEWCEVRRYGRRVETIVDGHTYSRTEPVVEVVRDWQPLCRRKCGLLGDRVERVRVSTLASVSERVIVLADDPEPQP
jgi:nitrite reductase/ring-hydroxylating ferredoxin subunit